MSNLVFTCGDVNGIGPEIVLKALNIITRRHKHSKYYLYIPSNVFSKAAGLIKPEFNFSLVKEEKFAGSESPVTIISQTPVKLKIGKASKDSGKAAYTSLKASFDLVKKGNADAVITAPLSKTAFNLAGINFPGQTELFAHWCKTKIFTMMFLSDKLNVALHTIHVPLKKVPGLVKENSFINKINLLHQTLKVDLGISKPKIAVLGLNPHAGEGGVIGREEADRIIPLIKKLKRKISIEGPFSSDAFFAKRRFKDFDLTYGLYHDQVLIPFKYLNAGKGVNFTAGLPIIRTSPDHGVAYDIAWKGVADESSIIKAVDCAKQIARNRKKNAADY